MFSDHSQAGTEDGLRTCRDTGSSLLPAPGKPHTPHPLVSQTDDLELRTARLLWLRPTVKPGASRSCPMAREHLKPGTSPQHWHSPGLLLSLPCSGLTRSSFWSLSPADTIIWPWPRGFAFVAGNPSPWGLLFPQHRPCLVT